MDLFGGDDEDGDIFGESSVAPPTLQSRNEVVVEEEEEVKQAPQKKVNIHTCTLSFHINKCSLTI